MKRILRSAIRIAFGVIGALAVLTAVAGWALRQPTFGSVPFPGRLHAEARALRTHVEFLSAAEGTRDWRHPAGLTRAADYIAAVFRKAGARCSEQPYRAGTVPMSNVIARFGPEDGPRIVVGAHYDACGPHPAADDNASGVAGLLELARLLDTSTLRSTVELVAYSTEEPPFFGGEEMGSAVHARSMREAGVQVRAMISLEMIGFFTPLQPSSDPLLQLLYPRDGHFIACAGRWSDRDLVRKAKRCFRGATHVQAVSYSGPMGPGIDLSDQRNYWARGFPAFMITDTGPLRNPNYHCPTDTADSLDYDRMAGVVDGAFSTVVYLANAR